MQDSKAIKNHEYRQAVMFVQHSLNIIVQSLNNKILLIKIIRELV